MSFIWSFTVTLAMLASSSQASLISISGKLQTFSGVGIPGVAINWNNPAGGSASTTSDSNGMYSFNNISPGQMTIGVSNSYETANPSIPIGFQALSTFTMVSSSANVDITLPPMVTYQVEVLDESGNPVPNVEVYPSQNSEWIDICPSSPIVAQGTNTCFLEYIGSDNFGVKVSTNTNGHAAITFFQLSGKNVQISARTNIRGIVGEVNLGASSNLTLTMPPIISVSGRVLSPSGLPVPRISLFWSNIYGVVRQSTNDDGSFTFFNVIGGAMTLAVDNGGALIPGVIPVATRVSMDLNLNQSTGNIDIYLFPVVNITVLVLDGDGNPLPNVSVKPCNPYYIPNLTATNAELKEAAVQSMSCSVYGGSVDTGADGTATLWFLQATPDYSNWKDNNQISLAAASNANTVLVTAAQGISPAAHSTVVMRMPRLISVGGFLRTSTGAPVSGIVMSCAGDHTVTAADGSFAFTSVIPGNVRFTLVNAWPCQIHHGLFPCGFVSATSITALNSTSDIVVTLPEVVTYNVTVTDERDGGALQGVSVYPANPDIWYNVCPPPMVVGGSTDCFGLYVGGFMGAQSLTDSTGVAAISFFKLPLDVVIGAMDPSNAARVGSATVSLTDSSSAAIALPSAPSVPRDLSGTNNGTALNLLWDPPSYGLPLDSYVVTVQQQSVNSNAMHIEQNAAEAAAVSVQVSPSAKGVSLTDLEPSVSYVVHLVATNRIGQSHEVSVFVQGATHPPTQRPSGAPTLSPTATPSVAPTQKPISAPPTVKPTTKPTVSPSAPSRKPADKPFFRPTRTPTNTPTVKPTRTPTNTPSVKPTRTPSVSPSSKPLSASPTRRPYFRPA